MHVRMRRVVVRRCDPFETCAKVFLDVSDQFSGQSFQIDALTKLGRNNELKQSRIASFLPRTECEMDVRDWSRRTKGSNVIRIAVHRAFSCEIPAMRCPLAPCSVCGIRHADRASLHERSRWPLGTTRWRCLMPTRLRAICMMRLNAR